MNKTGYIAGIARGHNGGVCLLKDGEVVFSIEEERLSRKKYDGGPYASIVKILDYTDKLDYLVISHTQEDTSHTDFSGDTVYKALIRKLRLINEKDIDKKVIEVHENHHEQHAAVAFYRSGFEKAVSLIVDGAGTFLSMGQETVWETESIFECAYPAEFKKIYTHIGGRGPFGSARFTDNKGCETVINESAGIVKAYEAVTQYCGWQPIEAGKTMGLFPYGKENLKIPKIYHNEDGLAAWTSTNRNLIIPTYPNGALVNANKYKELEGPFEEVEDVTLLQNRRDMAYAVQTQSQQQVLDLIRKAVKMSGNKNVVISGGYGLNCVANYWYLGQLKDEGINLYVEPISNDAGTAIGAAMAQYHKVTNDTTVRKRSDTLYFGFEYNYSDEDIANAVAKVQNAKIINTNATYADAVKIMRDKNIVAMFQGKSENGPRALGNRSLMFDPTFKDGKDYVNLIKNREYFRPFAASVLKEDTKDWFDLRGMESSPHMMYAVNCQPGVEEKIPSVIHIDGTCRIQTVTKDQNEHYHNLITEFKNQTGVPLVFNTSFNLGGDPLVETIDDALYTLEKSKLEYLYLPEYKIIIKVSN